MASFTLNDAGIASVLNQERYEQAIEDFGTLPEDKPVKDVPVEKDDLSWMQKMEISPFTGRFAKTIDNVLTVLEHDPGLKGKIAFDEFANRGLVLGPPFLGIAEIKNGCLSVLC